VAICTIHCLYQISKGRVAIKVYPGNRRRTAARPIRAGHLSDDTKNGPGAPPSRRGRLPYCKHSTGCPLPLQEHRTVRPLTVTQGTRRRGGSDACSRGFKLERSAGNSATTGTDARRPGCLATAAQRHDRSLFGDRPCRQKRSCPAAVSVPTSTSPPASRKMPESSVPVVQDDLEACQEPSPKDRPPARSCQVPDMESPETEPE